MNKKKDNKEKKEKNEEILSRREFLSRIGTGALVVTGLGAAAVSWDYLTPKVLFEPPLRFRVGRPEDYSPGSLVLDEKRKIFIVRDPQGYFYCLSATCTHLGCLTFWKRDEKLIACPCHGSRFSSHGEVVHGPAPRNLPHFLITLDERGYLIVDKSEIVKEDYKLKV